MKLKDSSLITVKELKEHDVTFVVLAKQFPSFKEKFINELAQQTEITGQELHDIEVVLSDCFDNINYNIGKIKLILNTEIQLHKVQDKRAIPKNMPKLPILVELEKIQQTLLLLQTQLTKLIPSVSTQYYAKTNEGSRVIHNLMKEWTDLGDCISEAIVKTDTILITKLSYKDSNKKMFDDDGMEYEKT